MSLTSDQVQAYLDRCGVPQEARDSLSQGRDANDVLKALTTLQQHHMVAIPYENLSLHYSEVREAPQDTKTVFEHVVSNKRGGNCVQQNLLFAELLRSLGISAYRTAVRLNAAASASPAPGTDRSKVEYGPWLHVINIVTIDDKKYVVDTNFNQFGSPFPVPLVHNEPVTDVWTRRRRMIHERIPGWAETDQKWWRMQVMHEGDDYWMDVYCFREVEWMALDFALQLAGIQKLDMGWFNHVVVCYRIIVEDEVPVGWIMARGDKLTRSYKGLVQTIETFECESDRVAALSEHFGISLSEHEQQHIIGTKTELKEAFF
ncbi:hypothetical protein F5Y03DRAFT_369043 [Xylaria venustula]|nr:hypothetical protein F5Y03DRAFT_369043 [Xylaria venustula]